MMRPRVPPSSSGVVSATEVASYVYCPEQWRLQHGLGNVPQIRLRSLVVRPCTEDRGRRSAIAAGNSLAFVLVVLAALLVLGSSLQGLSMGQGVWALALVFGCLGLLLLVLSPALGACVVSAPERR